MKLYKYSLDQLKQAVESSTSMRQVLIKLNVAPYGGNYDVLRKALKFYAIDSSHFSGQAWNKGLSLSPRQPLKSYLQNKCAIHSNRLRNRLLKEKVFSHQCSNCHRKHWLGAPIPLELDHINGNNKDNQLENLRLLCPNCHAQTTTYRGKKRTRT